jgi:tRNA (guanine37-N1)-methyltransferase
VSYRFDILTLFPALFDGLRNESLIGKALEAQTIALELHNWREFATDRHSTVDDAPFGGGAGLVIKPDPLIKCLRAVVPEGSRKILLSPSGRKFDQKMAHDLAELPGLTLICGRYEGFDQRIEQHVDDVLSIGDFVLNGGEVAAMVVIEAVSRLLPGVIGNAASLAEESFADGLLEYPQYTRPRDFEGQIVPEVLLSGNHAAIAKWRHEQRVARTRTMRPDLLKG